MPEVLCKTMVVNKPLQIFYQDLAMALSGGRNIPDTEQDSQYIPCTAWKKPKQNHSQVSC